MYVCLTIYVCDASVLECRINLDLLLLDLPQLVVLDVLEPPSHALRHLPALVQARQPDCNEHKHHVGDRLVGHKLVLFVNVRRRFARNEIQQPV